MRTIGNITYIQAIRHVALTQCDTIGLDLGQDVRRVNLTYKSITLYRPGVGHVRQRFAGGGHLVLYLEYVLDGFAETVEVVIDEPW